MRMILGLSRAVWGVLIVLALVVAGITHAVAVLALPWRSHRDAFARLAALGPVGARVVLPQAGNPSDPLPFRDPAFAMAACRYDLHSQPFRLSILPFERGFVTLGFHSRHGLAFYGLTVRAADATRLDLVLLSKESGATPGLDMGAHAVKIEAPESDGFVLIATPAGNEVDGADALERLNAFQCRAEPTAP
jgi:uncharacterized membrane protein